MVPSSKLRGPLEETGNEVSQISNTQRAGKPIDALDARGRQPTPEHQSDFSWLISTDCNGNIIEKQQRLSSIPGSVCIGS